MKQKWLRQQVCPQVDEAGFTLIELLVVVFFLTVLSALAIPSMLQFANRSKESEARTYVSTINRSQQSYYLEHQQFGTLADLELGLSGSVYYSYTSAPTSASPGAPALTEAQPLSGTMRGFAGKVWLGTAGDGSTTSVSILCEGYPGNPPNLAAATTCP
ncbi:MAG: type IV pilin-like G/H family protein [Synechococcales bacterium]|nr:type IV pilin-like G/H family protein [Synechococcales bacterium]